MEPEDEIEYLSLAGVERALIDAQVPLHRRDQVLASLADGLDEVEGDLYFAPVGRGLHVCFELSLREA